MASGLTEVVEPKHQATTRGAFHTLGFNVLLHSFFFQIMISLSIYIYMYVFSLVQMYNGLGS